MDQDSMNSEDELLMAAEEYENRVSGEPRRFCSDCKYFAKVEDVERYICLLEDEIYHGYYFEPNPYLDAEDCSGYEERDAREKSR